MGLIAKDYTKKLEILDAITKEDLRSVKRLLQRKIIRCELARQVDNLYISVLAKSGDESGEVIVSGKHTQVVRIMKDNRLLWENRESECEEENEIGCDKSLLRLG